MRIVRLARFLAQHKRNAAQRIAPQNSDCRAPWRAHQHVDVAPDLNTTYDVMPGPDCTITASDVGSATAGAVRGPASNWITVACCPGRRRVTSTVRPFGNSSAS